MAVVQIIIQILKGFYNLSWVAGRKHSDPRWATTVAQRILMIGCIATIQMGERIALIDKLPKQIKKVIYVFFEIAIELALLRTIAINPN